MDVVSKFAALMMMAMAQTQILRKISLHIDVSWDVAIRESEQKHGNDAEFLHQAKLELTDLEDRQAQYRNIDKQVDQYTAEKELFIVNVASFIRYREIPERLYGHAVENCHKCL